MFRHYSLLLLLVGCAHTAPTPPPTPTNPKADPNNPGPMIINSQVEADVETCGKDELQPFIQDAIPKLFAILVLHTTDWESLIQDAEKRGGVAFLCAIRKIAADVDEQLDAGTVYKVSRSPYTSDDQHFAALQARRYLILYH